MQEKIASSTIPNASLINFYANKDSALVDIQCGEGLIGLSILCVIVIAPILGHYFGAGVGFVVFFIGVYFVYIAGKRVRRYDATRDIAYCETQVHQSEETKLAWGRAAAKLLLGGVAGSSWQKGAGFTAGASAVAAGMIPTHVTTSSRHVEVILHFMDGNRVDLITSDAVAQWLLGVALFESRDSFDRYERMKKDPQRVSVELRGRIDGLESQYIELDRISKDGATFDERDNAELSKTLLLNDIRRLSSIVAQLDRLKLIS